MPAASISLVSALPTLMEQTSLQSQMMFLCGFVVLIWVLMRRTIRAKKRDRASASQWERHQRQSAPASDSPLPLANTPVEILRWQGAMFDLQRELKAELETKISVLQAMVQLADQRIATLQSLQPVGSAGIALPPADTAAPAAQGPANQAPASQAPASQGPASQGPAAGSI